MTMYTRENQHYTDQQVRMALPHISLPAVLLPDHVAPYGFTVYTPPPVPEPGIFVPQQITRLQAIAALYQAGQLPNVEHVINQAGGMTKIAWDNALTFDRNSPTLGALAAAMGWPDSYIDQLFIAAVNIKV